MHLGAAPLLVANHQWVRVREDRLPDLVRWIRNTLSGLLIWCSSIVLQETSLLLLELLIWCSHTTKGDGVESFSGVGMLEGADLSLDEPALEEEIIDSLT